MRVELSNGAWADLREFDTFKHRERKALVIASDAGEGDASKAIAMSDRMLSIFVEAWSFPMPAPALDPSSVDELDMYDYDKLIEACSAEMKKLRPAFDQMKPPSVPSVPSST